MLQINDLAYEAVKDPATGQLMFNVVVGGYFSGQRNIMSVPLGVAVTEEQLIPFTVALLRVFRYACRHVAGFAGPWHITSAHLHREVSPAWPA